ncbi:MAG: FAD-dependent oxidoreductase [Verrucomicrobia bacterium]|nr:FAD-dependent oxidoreductase [Verrucomicrobiota bacterium]
MIPRLLLSLVLLPPALTAADVVIYGGTPAGITAAIQTARMHRTAILIEPTRFLGGLTTGGLGATDIGNKKAIGGISREFYANVHRYYKDPAKWRHETRDAYFSRKPHGNSTAETTMWTFEPHVASEIYAAMLREAGDRISIVHGERLDLEKGVVKSATRIRKIVMESGREFSGSIYIDATYEGDLMAGAGVDSHIGREANRVYGETLNGVQTTRAVHHQFNREVDPYIVPGDPSSGLLPGIGKEPGEEFAGDHKVQAYNFRMCTTDVPENRRPWTKPETYDERWFELALRNVEAGDQRISWAPAWMPNRKTDTNNNFAVSTDFIGMNWPYAEAGYAEREKIRKAHEDWQKGLLWTYAHHPRVPEAIRAVYRNLGLARDEFTENENWPRQLYIREARRMISDHVMTEKNCKREEVVADSVGMGAYNMDSHHVQRYVTKEGFVRNEGDVQVPSRPYPVSYRSLRPKAAQCANLLVPVCLSASHIAYGSIRMEPVFMVLGQSAATAAVHAIEQEKSVQEIDLAKLKERLLEDGQVLDFESPPTPVPTGSPKSSLPGIIVDDQEARLTGFDAVGHTAPGFVEAGYRHDGDSLKGTQTARFIPNLPRAGTYRVSISYGALANRASNVPITIHHADGETRLTVDQRRKPDGPGSFHPLGSFPFAAGTTGWVEIGNAETQGHVIADAVQFLPGEPRTP